MDSSDPPIAAITDPALACLLREMLPAMGVVCEVITETGQCQRAPVPMARTRPQRNHPVAPAPRRGGDRARPHPSRLQVQGTRAFAQAPGAGTGRVVAPGLTGVQPRCKVPPRAETGFAGQDAGPARQAPRVAVPLGAATRGLPAGFHGDEDGVRNSSGVLGRIGLGRREIDQRCRYLDWQALDAARLNRQAESVEALHGCSSSASTHTSATSSRPPASSATRRPSRLKASQLDYYQRLWKGPTATTSCTGSRSAWCTSASASS